MREKPREKQIYKKDLLNEFKDAQRSIWQTPYYITLFLLYILDPSRVQHKKSHPDYLRVAMREK